MVDGCEECTRLWREYAEATNEHFKVDNELQLAGLKHDHEVIQKLDPEVQDSYQKRKALRGQISAHEKQVHDGASD